jgi:hypothetical protein
MRLKKLDAFMIFGLALVMSEFVRADDPTAVPVSTTDQRSLMSMLSEKTVLNYFGIFRGGPLNSVSNSQQPSVNGALTPTNPISVENSITGGYKINKDLMVGVLGHFMYYPAGYPSGTGHDLQMLDPALLIQKNNLYKTGGLTINGRFLFAPALTQGDYLVPNHLAAALTPTIIFNYEVANTGLNIGLFTYYRFYIPNASAASDVRTYKIYAAPTLNYQLAKNLAATLWVDLVQASRYGGTSAFNLANDPIDIEPGINWDITKNISLNPILNIYPSNPTIATTSFQAFIVAKAF